MTLRSVLVAAILALGFATAASALPAQNAQPQYTNTVGHNFYGQ